MPRLFKRAVPSPAPSPKHLRQDKVGLVPYVQRSRFFVREGLFWEWDDALATRGGPASCRCGEQTAGASGPGPQTPPGRVGGWGGTIRKGGGAGAAITPAAGGCQHRRLLARDRVGRGSGADDSNGRHPHRPQPPPPPSARTTRPERPRAIKRHSRRGAGRGGRGAARPLLPPALRMGDGKRPCSGGGWAWPGGKGGAVSRPMYRAHPCNLFVVSYLLLEHKHSNIIMSDLGRVHTSKGP